MPPVLPVQSVHPKTLTVRTALQKSAPASPQSQQSLLPHTTPSPITESPAVSSTGYLPPPLIDNTLAGHGGTQMTLTSYPNHFDQSLIRMHWLQALVEEEAKKDVAPNPSAEAQEDENAGPGMSQSGCGDSVPDSPFHNVRLSRPNQVLSLTSSHKTSKVHQLINCRTGTGTYPYYFFARGTSTIGAHGS